MQVLNKYKTTVKEGGYLFLSSFESRKRSDDTIVHECIVFFAFWTSYVREIDVVLPALFSLWGHPLQSLIRGQIGGRLDQGG